MRGIHPAHKTGRRFPALLQVSNLLLQGSQFSCNASSSLDADTAGTAQGTLVMSGAEFNLPLALLAPFVPRGKQLHTLSLHTCRFLLPAWEAPAALMGARQWVQLRRLELSNCSGPGCMDGVVYELVISALRLSSLRFSLAGPAEPEPAQRLRELPKGIDTHAHLVKVEVLSMFKEKWDSFQLDVELRMLLGPRECVRSASVVWLWRWLAAAAGAALLQSTAPCHVLNALLAPRSF